MKNESSPQLAPSQTLYINNLNEKLGKDELKRCLYGLFSQYGQILDVIALKTPKMRGQAFIVYKELPSAVAAMRALQGYPFFGKSLRIQFGRTQSKATREFELYAVEPARQEQTIQQLAHHQPQQHTHP